MLADWSFGGGQRVTASGFCPNPRSFSWEQERRESLELRAAKHRAVQNSLIAGFFKSYMFGSQI